MNIPGPNDPFNERTPAVHHHFFNHGTVSHDVRPVTNDLLADATNDIHIVTKTPNNTLYQRPECKMTKQTLIP